MFHVYIDLDSVLFDLPKAMSTFAGVEDINQDKSLFWKLLPEFARKGGFQYLDKMPKADELVFFLTSIPKHLVSLSILTSAGEFYDPVAEVIVQKKRALDAKFPDLKKIPFTATVCGADKAFFAHPKSLLIDDHPKNIDKFIAAGGNGFVWNATTSDLVNLKFMLFKLYTENQ